MTSKRVIEPRLKGMVLGGELRRLRESRGLTLRDVCRRLKINPAVLSTAELSQFLPAAELILRLCDLYRVRPRRLLRMLRSERMLSWEHELSVRLERLDEQHESLLRAWEDRQPQFNWTSEAAEEPKA